MSSNNNIDVICAIIGVRVPFGLYISHAIKNIQFFVVFINTINDP